MEKEENGRTNDERALEIELQWMNATESKEMDR